MERNIHTSTTRQVRMYRLWRAERHVTACPNDMAVDDVWLIPHRVGHWDIGAVWITTVQQTRMCVDSRVVRHAFLPRAHPYRVLGAWKGHLAMN